MLKIQAPEIVNLTSQSLEIFGEDNAPFGLAYSTIELRLKTLSKQFGVLQHGLHQLPVFYEDIEKVELTNPGQPGMTNQDVPCLKDRFYIVYPSVFNALSRPDLLTWMPRRDKNGYRLAEHVLYGKHSLSGM